MWPWVGEANSQDEAGQAGRAACPEGTTGRPGDQRASHFLNGKARNTMTVSHVDREPAGPAGGSREAAACVASARPSRPRAPTTPREARGPAFRPRCLDSPPLLTALKPELRGERTSPGLARPGQAGQALALRPPRTLWPAGGSWLGRATVVNTAARRGPPAQARRLASEPTGQGVHVMKGTPDTLPGSYGHSEAAGLCRHSGLFWSAPPGGLAATLLEPVCPRRRVPLPVTSRRAHPGCAARCQPALSQPPPPCAAAVPSLCRAAAPRRKRVAGRVQTRAAGEAVEDSLPSAASVELVPFPPGDHLGWNCWLGGRAYLHPETPTVPTCSAVLHP